MAYNGAHLHRRFPINRDGVPHGQPARRPSNASGSVSAAESGRRTTNRLPPQPPDGAAAAASSSPTTLPPVCSRPSPFPPIRRRLRPLLPPLLSPPHHYHQHHYHHHLHPPLTSAHHPAPTPPLLTHHRNPPPSPYRARPLLRLPRRRRTTAPPPASSSLPAFLAAECADFSSSSTTVPALSPPPRVLPSELCLLRREVDSWGGHQLPGAYSYPAARVAAALRFGVTRWEAELRRWLLANSPRYGVVIDAAIRDHVFVLVRLCLKAAAAEAGCSLEWARKGGIGGFGFDPRAVRFECPRLVGAVSWLVSQLEVLYGERYGRFFAVVAIKEAILQLASCLSVGVGGGGVGEAGNGGGAREEGSELGNIGTCPIFVSQVAAAIVALHERFSLEENIRALQAPRPSKYQLLLEYSHVLARGHEERSKRPNYRAILEYDGILARRVENQESGRSKTREELLAEERDYKRRRMSYRGKKMKRNPTEILRDIIDEHMEEIKQAGGVGYLVEAPGDTAQNMLKSNSHGGTCQGRFDPTSSSVDKAVLGSQFLRRENSPHTDSFGRVSSRSHDTRGSYRNLRYETRGHQYQNVSEHKKGVIKESESTTDRSYSNQHENNIHKRNSNGERKYDYKYKKSISVSDHHSESSDCTTWSTRRPKSSGTEYDRMSGDRSNDRTITSQNRYRSVPVNQDQFSDRYDPQSTYTDEDPPTSMCYDVSEGKDDIYHDETHSCEHHIRKRNHHH